jgi:hypothetical protein
VIGRTWRRSGSVARLLAGQPTAGYVLAGDSNVPQFNGLVPWLAKVDGSGALIWQENDYQANNSTGLPLSEYFASSALTPAGPVALGYTENWDRQPVLAGHWYLLSGKAPGRGIAVTRRTAATA